jgi:hypothetical protein
MPKVAFSLWVSFSTFGLIELIDLQLYWIIRKISVRIAWKKLLKIANIGAERLTRLTPM